MRADVFRSAQLVSQGKPLQVMTSATDMHECLIVGVQPADAALVVAEAKSFGMVSRIIPAECFDGLNRVVSSAVTLVVNVDAFDLVEIVDALISFRRQSPDVSVIILSAAFGGDEFQGERKAICDVSLRLPLSARRIQRAFSEMQPCQDSLECFAVRAMS